MDASCGIHMTTLVQIRLRIGLDLRTTSTHLLGGNLLRHNLVKAVLPRKIGQEQTQ